MIKKLNDTDLRSKNTAEKVASLSAQTLIAILEAAYDLRKALEGGQDTSETIKQQEPMMLLLMEYLIMNMDNPNIDKQIFLFLEKIFGEKLKKLKKKNKSQNSSDINSQDQSEEIVNEADLTKEEKEMRVRLIIYEIYKMTNPNRLAGETEMDNFIKNVKTRGLEVALKYDGHDMANKFTPKELKNLSSYKDLVQKQLHDAGSRGAGF